MARYIDADKLLEKAEEIEWFNEGTGFYNHINIVHKYDVETAPNADVVPKSEVEKALNEVELLIIITKEMYKQQMEDAPNELSKQSKRTKWVAFEKFYEQFAELKKKYTEGEK